MGHASAIGVWAVAAVSMLYAGRVCSCWSHAAVGVDAHQSLKPLLLSPFIQETKLTVKQKLAAAVVTAHQQQRLRQAQSMLGTSV